METLAKRRGRPPKAPADRCLKKVKASFTETEFDTVALAAKMARVSAALFAREAILAEARRVIARAVG